MSFWDDLTDGISGFVDELIDDVSGVIDDVISTGSDIISDVGDTIGGFFEPVIDAGSAIIGDIIDNISGAVSGAIATGQGVISDIVDNISGAVSGAVNTVSQVAGELIDEYTPDFSDLIANVSEWIDSWDEDVKNDTTRVVDKGSDEADNVQTEVITAVTQAAKAAARGAANLLPDIQFPDLTFLLDLIPGFNAILKPLISGVSDIGSSFETVTKALPSKETLDLGSLTVKTAGLGFNIGQGFSEADSNKLGSGVYDTLISTAANLGAVVGSPLGLLPVVMDAYQASLGAHVQNRARLISTPGRVGVNELAAALWRGYIDSPAAIRQAGEQGFDSDNFQIMVDLAKQLLGANEVISLMLRSEITEKEAAARLSKLGYANEDISHIKKLAYQIPGVQDLIRMAVREAFTPEIAEKFGQYEDYPEALTQYTQMIGLSEEWAKRYWASHWELPGINMGFEMVHRGVIDESELNMLLRALDVMPFWRDKLTQISYSPYTRVDIRRMHKLGVLTDADVLRAYQDIGYALDKATKLTDFTILLNAEDTKLEQAANRDLTLSMVKTAYQDNIISDDELSLMVAELGYDEFESALIIMTEQYKRNLKIRNKEIDIVKMRVLYYKITLNDAIDQFNKLGLAEHEVKYHILDLQLDLEIAEAKAAAAEQKKAATAAAKG